MRSRHYVIVYMDIVIDYGIESSVMYSLLVLIVGWLLCLSTRCSVWQHSVEEVRVHPLFELRADPSQRRQFFDMQLAPLYFPA